MYVCICNAITEREIREAAARGATKFKQLRDGLGVANCCGACESCARQILQEATSAHGTLSDPQFA